MRAAITPIVTVLGLDIGILLGGRDPHRDRLQHPRHRAAWPTTRSSARTSRSIQGTVLFGAFFIVVRNLVVDIAYAFIDPRVRYQ